MSRGNVAGSDHSREPFSRAHLADHRQVSRQVRGTYRVPVAHGAVQGRRIAVGGDVVREHPSRRGVQGHLFRRGKALRGAHRLDNQGPRLRKLEWIHLTILCRRRPAYPLRPGCCP